MKLLGWYQTKAHIYIAMEYLPEGDLSARVVEAIPEAEARRISYQLLEGLDFMHRKSFTRRDLKLSVGKPPMLRHDAAERIECFHCGSCPEVMGQDRGLRCLKACQKQCHNLAHLHRNQLHGSRNPRAGDARGRDILLHKCCGSMVPWFPCALAAYPTSSTNKT